MELEADAMGIELMARAGYDPRNASNVWRKMQAQRSGGGSKSDFFDTHPNDERRMAQLDATVPKVLALYIGVPSVGAAAEPSVGATSVPRSISASPPPQGSFAAGTPAGAPAVKSAAKVGQDSYTVERLAKQQSCGADAMSELIDKGPGFERYAVSCGSGVKLSYRCEFGNCKLVQ
jgi:hypothetical protein